MRLVYFGSGAFGVPTLGRLVATHEVALVVTQPDRPAGRSRRLTPTPVAGFAAAHALSVIRPERVNEPDVVETIRAVAADAFVVIAYGHKMGPGLLAGVFAINLHASLLPKYRGAAPINRAMMCGESETGVSVIEVADRMDAGDVLGRLATPIDPAETAGELHDRLAALGPDLVLDVLARHEAGTLAPRPQDETQVSQAPKLSKAEGTVDFDQPARSVRCRIHGLTPWPGCTVSVGAGRLALRRAEVVDDDDAGVAPGTAGVAPGTVREDGTVGCNPGAVRLLEVVPPGRREMTFDDYRRGHDVAKGTRLRPA